MKKTQRQAKYLSESCLFFSYIIKNVTNPPLVKRRRLVADQIFWNWRIEYILTGNIIFIQIIPYFLKSFTTMRDNKPAVHSDLYYETLTKYKQKQISLIIQVIQIKQKLLFLFRTMFNLGNILNKKSNQSEQILAYSNQGMDLANVLIQSNIEKDKKRLNQKYKFPAKKKNAYLHMQAIKFGYKPRLKQKNKVCPCCMQNIRTRKLPICEDTTILSEGDKNFRIISGVALFFTFIKALCLFFLIRSLTMDIFNMITNLTQGQSCEGECVQQFWTTASIFHKDDRADLVNTTDLLALLTILVSIAYFLFYRKIQYKIYCIIDERNQTEDDYTLFVEDVPILNFPEKYQNKRVDFDYDADLDQLFTKKIRKWLSGQDGEEKWIDPAEGTLEHDYHQNIQLPLGYQNENYVPDDIIKTISLCYDISEIQKIKKLREDIMKRHQEDLAKPQQQRQSSSLDDRFDTPPEQVHFLNEIQVKISQNYKANTTLIFKTTHFIGSAFISFKYQHFRDYILQKYEQNPEEFKMKGKQLLLSQATYPSDIKWKNLSLERQERSSRRVYADFILLIVLLFAFGLLLGTDILKQFLQKVYLDQGKTQKDPEEGSSINIGSQLITLMATVITLIINYLIQVAVYQFVERERHQTKTNQKYSLVYKLVISQFVNTAFIYYIISLINNKTNDDLMSASGLVYQISSLITTSGVIQIFTNAFNIPAILRRLTLWWMKRDKGQDFQEYQIHLNQKFEYIEFDIAQRYSYYILQLWTVSFYAYIVPIGVPAMMIIFFFQYWVDKFNLFRRSSLFYQIHYSLSRSILKLAEFSVFIFALGIVVFSWKIHHKITPINIVSLVIGVIFAFLSLFLPERIQRKFFRKYETSETESYDECVKKGKFQQTYWTLNPVTMLLDQRSTTKRKVVRNEAAAILQIVEASDIPEIVDEDIDQQDLDNKLVEEQEEEVE